MSRKISLKWLVTLIFLGLGILLVAGYSLLSAHYFRLGMESMLLGNMEHAAQRYERQSTSRSRERVAGGYHITPTWQEQPADVRRAFPVAPKVSGALLKYHQEGAGRNSGGDSDKGVLYFAMRYQSASDTLYISHQISQQTVSALVHRSARENLRTLLLISLVSALALLLIIWLLIRRISRPVAALGEWAKSLNPGMLQEPVPDFYYPELNEMAALVRASLSSLEEHLEREHRFLRHTSHEIRTPISVIRNNIELVRSLPGEPLQSGNPALGQIVDRIDRASLTMKHLTETLLWLSKDSSEALPTRPVPLDELIRQLIQDHRYLLEAKDVQLEVETDPVILDLPEAPVRIVVGNLIRNAFQHTWSGVVTVTQSGSRIAINNVQRDENLASDDDLGFGLGLQLTAQLSERLGWHYINEPAPQGHRVTLDLRQY